MNPILKRLYITLYNIVKTYVQDSFTDTDGKSLLLHVPNIDVVGGGWQFNGALVTPWTIQSNQVNTGSSGGHAYINSGKSDVIVSARAVTATGGRFGLVFRFVNSSNYWIVYSASDGRFLQIREITSGTETQRAITSGVSQTVPFNMIATLNGNSISVSFGTNTVTYSSSQHVTATRHGLYTFGTNGRYDDFLVEKL